MALLESVRLSEEQVEQMWDANPRGGGAAWREGPEEERVVKWKKGLNKEEMLELNRILPLPFVLHFRIPSHGTSSSWLACHPFQIDAEATVAFEGETSGYVLFHNGFWTGWKEKMQTMALNGCVKVPSGPWSDSRGLAWTAHHLGLGFLELVDEKVLAFGPKDEDIETFGSWSQFKNINLETNKEESVLVSNKLWERTFSSSIKVDDRRTQTTLDLAHKALHGEPGGAPAPLTFPGRGPCLTASSGPTGADQKPIQEAAEVDTKENGKVIAGLLPASTLDTLCGKCGKRTNAGYLPPEGKWSCWQCWSEDEKEKDAARLSLHSPPGSKPHVGLCHFCKIQWAGSRRKDNNLWICRTCYETNGHPDVYLSSTKTGEVGCG